MISVELFLKSFVVSIIYFVNYSYSSSEENTDFIGAFYSLQDVLKVFHKEQYKYDPTVIKALRMFHALEEDVGNFAQYDYNNPFIAIEGNHRSRRFIVARQLARALRATNMRNPPEFMNFLKFHLHEVEPRRAFYSLGLYASALEARRILPERPVVTAGYWLDIAAFSLSKKYPDGFPENSSEFTWPKDLLAPDVIFYINSPPPIAVEGQTTKAPNPIREKLVEVYRRWTYPRVVELNERLFSYSEMFTEIFRHVNFLKQSKYKKYLNVNRHNLQ
ncbi:UMP-CMP kinase 2, mitochondrial-like [Macrosteles quadrilineatus]|uniref:UMP-CMP kinase 2, mitochondrial-like n=1 Tax=Macrosteles quadrilineatus TaxID=74068 RepID=UPI0023E32EDA|nr:UMP-CMP kinase 2, mitochondrial-like [Macrosteles quadrilineatus]